MPLRVEALRSPTHVVIGATDLEATVGFLGRLGLLERRRRVREESTHLYGIDGVTEVELCAAGTGPGGRVVVVSGAQPGRPRDPYARGASALDLYTRSTSTTLRVLEGVPHGPTGHVVLGPLAMEQTWFDGPDVPLVTIESERRRHSILDTSEAPHSEVHSVVWSVDGIEDEGRWWARASGLEVAMVFGFSDAEVCSFMRLPRTDVRIRMTMLSGADNAPVRLELLEFADEPGPTTEDLPLAAGLHAVRFAVEDVTALADQLRAAGAQVGPVIDGAVTFRSPGGVRGQLVRV